MKRTTAQVLGVIVAVLALIGLFIEDRHLLGLMNVDLALDLLRIPVAAALLYAGFAAADMHFVRNVLISVGVLYLAIGLVGLIDREFGGLLPMGLTAFDILFHLAAGAFATWAGYSHGERMAMHHP